MSFLDLTGEIILLAAGMILLMWGLRIFKIYIIAGGVMIGAAVGMAVGLYTQQSELSLLILALVGALTGGIIACPIQKAFVLLLTGIFSALIGLAIVYKIGFTTDNWQTIGLIAFVVGGLIAFILFDYIIIILVAFSGAQLIFWRDNLDALAISKDMIRSFDFSNYINNIIHIVEQNLFYFLFLTLIFVLFGIYFQKRKKPISSDSEDIHRKKIIFRRTSYILMLIFLIVWPLARLDLSGQTYPLIGYDFLSWPVVAVIFSFFIIRLKLTKVRIFHSIIIRYCLLMIFGVAIVPLISYLVSSVSLMYFGFDQLTKFYTGFSESGTSLSLYKAIYSGLLFPLLFMLPVIRHRVKTVVTEEKEEKKKTEEDRIDSSDMNSN